MPLFLNLFSINSCAASDTGNNPSINNAAIFGININTAPIVTPNCNIPFISYFAAIPIITPITDPIIKGSPNNPNFFCNVSAFISILFIPGIRSNNLFTTIAIGTKACVNPWGRDIPGIPKYSSIPGAVKSAITNTITIFATAANTPHITLWVAPATKAPVKAKCQ